MLARGTSLARGEERMAVNLSETETPNTNVTLEANGARDSTVTILLIYPIITPVMVSSPAI